MNGWLISLLDVVTCWLAYESIQDWRESTRHLNEIKARQGKRRLT